MDAERASVVCVAPAVHQAVALAEANQRGHRLLGEPGSLGDLAHPQSVLLEQRQQHRAVGRAHLAETTLGEALREQLVPVLGRLRQQEAEIACVGAISITHQKKYDIRLTSAFESGYRPAARP